MRRVLALALSGVLFGGFARAAGENVAFDLFEQTGDASVLVHELNCVACHEGEVSAGLPPRGAPNLAETGTRLRAEWIRAFLLAPAEVAPGSTHPDLLAGLPRDEAETGADALANFLSMHKSTRTVEEAPQRGNAEVGLTTYAEAACAVCHGPADQFRLHEKFLNARGLADFLQAPRRLNPHGRMPSMNLSPEEAINVASALLRGGPPKKPGPAPTQDQPGVRYEVFYGDWDRLPDFNSLKPVKTGVAADLSPVRADREDFFGVRHTGYLRIEVTGDYVFSTNSDDGSRLFVGHHLVVNNDGVHGGVKKSGRIRLQAGKHAFTSLFFEKEGGHHNHVTWSGPGFEERPLAGDLLTHSPEEHPGTRKPRGLVFTPEFEKVQRGKALFRELNCISCHAIEPKGKTLRPEGILGPPTDLAHLHAAAGQGCLSPEPTASSPHFRLTPKQNRAIVAFLSKPASSPKRKPAELLRRSMLAHRCTACHERDGVGKPSPASDPHFLTTEQAMGPEGRLPPHLNGVGAKLKADWLRQVIAGGNKVRPYVLARMPAYGNEIATELARALVEADLPAAPPPPAKLPEVTERDARKHGRSLVGSNGLSCVACHVFAGIPSQGVQGMDLAVTDKRLRPDWFRRYLVDPASLRPGTRMPSFWPEGVSTKPDVLGGDSAKQIEAIRAYLALGSKAPVPAGLAREGMHLAVGREARLYRNFIDGVGPRAIAVGYPGEVNLAWDANQLRPALLWHGSFVDPTRHWTGRGQGFQPPDGYNLLRLPDGPPLAILPNTSTSWPAPPANHSRPADFRFRGYRLDSLRRPTFRYAFGETEVEDHFKEAAPGKNGDTALERTLTFRGPIPPNLYLRAAAGDTISLKGDSGFQLGPLVLTFLDPPENFVAHPRSRTRDLILPIPPAAKGKEFVLRQRLEW